MQRDSTSVTLRLPRDALQLLCKRAMHDDSLPVWVFAALCQARREAGEPCPELYDADANNLRVTELEVTDSSTTDEVVMSLDLIVKALTRIADNMPRRSSPAHTGPL